jgi:hypothetical protein
LCELEREPPGLLLLLLLWVFVEIFLFAFGFADIVALNVELLVLVLVLLIFRGFYNSTQSCSKDLSFACHYEFQHRCR